MPAVSMKPLLQSAALKGHAVGAFSVSSIEMITGVLDAAEEKGAAVILQVAQVRLKTTPLKVLGKAMLAAAEQASVPVCVHLDHGMTLDVIRQALDVGFTSVMFDGSMYDMEKNIALTNEVACMAAPYNASVEAEIGRIGRTESGEDAPAVCADPGDALYFANHTHVDAMAVAIGNAHGVYVGTPRLRFDVLEGIRAQAPQLPLVLHGGTGISDADFRECIRLGVRKINIATANFQAAVHTAASFKGEDYFELSDQLRRAAYAVAHKYMDIFAPST